MANPLNLIGTFGKQVFAQFSNKKHANKAYLQLIASVKRIISHQGRNSKNAKDLLDNLAGLAPFGAKRRNFRRRYIDKPNGWRELPDNPKDFPYGFWH